MNTAYTNTFYYDYVCHYLNTLKYCFLYMDDQFNDLVMVIGNRKSLSFDLKKIKALQVKIADILHVTLSATKSPSPKMSAKPKGAKPKPQAQILL